MLGYTGEIFGISIDEPLAELQSMVAAIATGVLQLFQHPGKLAAEDIVASADYLGAGYGVLGQLEREAIDVFARSEGILLDPVYTSRAAGGMLDMIRRGAVSKDETILFWHTGGLPALWAYAGELI